MQSINLYIFRQLLGPFVFFCLIIGGILWIAQALRISDIVVENGQPASVFLLLGTLVLPIAIKATIPIAGFAAAVYVTHKWISDSEFIVMMSSGKSLTQLAMPYLAFGGVVFVLMQVLLQSVLPSTTTKLEDARQEIAEEFVTQIIRPGEFISEGEKYTFYFGSKGKSGDVYDVMIEEANQDGTSVTHTATQGQVVKNGTSSNLLLINGISQRFDANSETLNIVRFDSFSFDLSSIRERVGDRGIRPEEFSFRELRATILTATPVSAEYATAQKEFHERLIIPLLALLTPVFGMVILCIGGFGRGSLLWRILLGVSFLFIINSLRGIFLDIVFTNPSLPLVGYLSFFLMLGLIAAYLLAEKHSIKIDAFIKRRFSGDAA